MHGICSSPPRFLMGTRRAIAAIIIAVAAAALGAAWLSYLSPSETTCKSSLVAALDANACQGVAWRWYAAWGLIAVAVFPGLFALVERLRDSHQVLASPPCSFCGRVPPDQSRYCPYCGHQREGRDESATRDSSEDGSLPLSDSTPATHSRRRLLGRAVVGVCIVLLLVGGATGSFLPSQLPRNRTPRSPISKQRERAFNACQADGATLTTAIAAFRAENPGATPDESDLLNSSFGGPYIQTWPSNPSWYVFNLNFGRLYLQSRSGAWPGIPFTGSYSCTKIGL